MALKKGHQHNGRHWLPNIEAENHKLTNTSKLFLYIRKKSLNKLRNKTQSSFVYSQHKKGFGLNLFGAKHFFSTVSKITEAIYESEMLEKSLESWEMTFINSFGF